MKRLFYLLLAGVLVSCGKNIEPAPAVDVSLIPGTWKITSATENPPFKTPQGPVTDLLAYYEGGGGQNCLGNTLLIFSTDGTLRRVAPSASCESATLDFFNYTEARFRVSGTRLLIESKNPPSSGAFDNIRVSATEMVWHRFIPASDSIDGQAHEGTITLTRQ